MIGEAKISQHCLIDAIFQIEYRIYGFLNESYPISLAADQDYIRFLIKTVNALEGFQSATLIAVPV